MVEQTEHERVVEENTRLRKALEFYGSGADNLNWNSARINDCSGREVEYPFRQDEHANPIKEPWKVADEALAAAKEQQ